jgi:hypothetical protein
VLLAIVSISAGGLQDEVNAGEFKNEVWSSETSD